MQLNTIIDEKIAEEEQNIEQSYNKIEALQAQKQRAKYTGDIKRWLDYDFVSSSGLTGEFALFVKEYKKAIKGIISPNLELVEFTRGHFYISGFLKNITSGKFIYFSTSDVRGKNNEWYNSILIRTAKNIKDYTGGANRFTEFEKLLNNVVELSR